MRNPRPLLLRILLPRVPWWAAVSCNVLSAAALVLLALDSEGNLLVAGTILVLAAVALYGTAAVVRVRKQQSHLICSQELDIG